MCAAGYNIDIKTWNDADEEINSDDSLWLEKGRGPGVAGRLKSKNQTEGIFSHLEGADTVYRNGSSQGRSNKFGHTLECMCMESQAQDSQSKIKLAIQLIAETLHELQKLISGDLFNWESTGSQAGANSNNLTPPDANNPATQRKDSPKESPMDQSIADIAMMLQYIEEMYPGFIDSMKGDPHMNAVDSTVSDRTVLLELLEELYGQLDLAINSLSQDDDASGQSDGIDRSRAIDDGVPGAIEGLKARITGQINQIEVTSPGFLHEVKPFLEGDLGDSKDAGSNDALKDALEELSELLEDLVALLNHNVVEGKLLPTDSLQENNEKAALPAPKVQDHDVTEVPGDGVTAPEEKLALMAPNGAEAVPEAVEAFMEIYDQLSDETKSEVAQILVGMVFDEKVATESV
jgi:hypothetical protein